jgi:hypothetical protein
MFDPILQRIIVSRDVIFEENQQWVWGDNNEENPVADLAWEHADNPTEAETEQETDPETDGSPTTNLGLPSTSLDHDEDGPEIDEDEVAEQPAHGSPIDCATREQEAHGSQAHGSPNRPLPLIPEARIRRRPEWLKDYELGTDLFDAGGMNFADAGRMNLAGEGGMDFDNMAGNRGMTFDGVNFAKLALFNTNDPSTFEEAVQFDNWRAAMNQEIEAIERNNTWELIDLPPGGKTVGVKWIFKTKLNEFGEVDKYKARLVAKGYSQQYGVDYAEVFAPVARLDTIRMVISLTAQRGWLIFQLDVKSAFLHGEIDEEVFVDQPAGFEKKGEESKVYRLKKALYGLKQAPRAWYSRIESYFAKEGFNKCPHEHTLFIKTADGGKILISCLYVDDLIFTGNNESMFEKFKKSMMAEFDMPDLGKMRYFLGIKVLQTNDGIFISQRKYAHEILERFHMGECNSVKNPIVPGFKLTRDEGGIQVDSTIYK